MIECIADTMRKKICKTIKDNDRKIAIITDKSTSLSKKACLIVYIRAVIFEVPGNIFLDIRELEGQDAESIVKCILATLSKFGFEEDTYRRISLHLQVTEPLSCLEYIAA